MAINLNDNLIVQAPKATDERYGPYNSEAEALIAIEPIIRYQGLTAGVYILGQLTEYWFRDGVSDADFIKKTTTGPITPDIHYDIGFCCSDETTDLTPGVKFTLTAPRPMVLKGVVIGANTAPQGSDVIVDIQQRGITIFSVKPVISNGSKVGGYNAIFPPMTVLFYRNSTITAVIDQVGSDIPGSGLKVWLIGDIFGGE